MYFTKKNEPTVPKFINNANLMPLNSLYDKTLSESMHDLKDVIYSRTHSASIQTTDDPLPPIIST